ncbi:low molecular weight phosphotyrosine protein phosphatase [Mitsuaria sp. GD03876]|uniref:arsenate reductase/protein-tyrosine-phosphatase family protein n=1 Tax=Mitsuaria sp. GD03876 TaxID=2975399 RepID=UPI0032646E67
MGESLAADPGPGRQLGQLLQPRHRDGAQEVRAPVRASGSRDNRAPDDRSQDHARRRGYELCDQRARALRPDDFERFDLLVAMDAGHLRELRRRCPAALQHKISLLPGEIQIPDPYYGGADGFDHVLDLLESGCARLAQIAAGRLA